MSLQLIAVFVVHKCVMCLYNLKTENGSRIETEYK